MLRLGSSHAWGHHGVREPPASFRQRDRRPSSRARQVRWERVCAMSITTSHRAITRRLVALAAVGALVCLAPAAASAFPKVEKRTFKVAVEGYQNNRWDFHH